MFHSPRSVFQGHSKDPKVQQLYQPLRKTFLADTTIRKTQLQEASQFSHLSHLVKTHTLLQNISLASHTLIFSNAKLRPTHNTWKIPKDKIYYIINVQQKVYQPISKQEMQKILANRQEGQEVIVYTVEDQSVRQQSSEHQNHIFQKKAQSFNYFQEPSVRVGGNIVSAHQYQHNINKLTLQQMQEKNLLQNNINKNLNQPKFKKQQKQQQTQPKKSVLQLNRKLNNKKSSGILVTQSRPKYNFFSAIDQPINNILQGKQCTCPTNQLVASQLNEISWYGTIGR